MVLANEGNLPHYDHISYQTLSHLPNEEIHHGISHPDAANGDGDSLVSTCNGKEPTLGRKGEQWWVRIQLSCNCVRTRRRSNSQNPVSNLACTQAQVVNALIGSAGKVCEMSVSKKLARGRVLLHLPDVLALVTRFFMVLCDFVFSLVLSYQLAMKF